MSTCRPLKIGDTCDKCGKGIMRPNGLRWWKYYQDKKQNEGIEIECDNCGHKHINVGFSEYLTITE